MAGRGLAKLIAEAVEASNLSKWLTPADPGFNSTGGFNDAWDLNMVPPPGPKPFRPSGPIYDQNQPGLPGLADVINDPMPTSEDADGQLAALIFNTVHLPDPSVRELTAFLDAGRPDLVTPELYGRARSRDPDALRQELTRRMPVGFVEKAPDLGMTERVFHYTEAGDGNLPGNPPFEVFQPSRGGFNQTFDSLGPHVGTFNAADERRYAKSVGAKTYLQAPPPGYLPDKHSEAAPFPLVPHRGSMMELAANLSKPFTPRDAEALSAEWSSGNQPLPWLSSYRDDAEWSEDAINNFLNDYLASTNFPAGVTGRTARMAQARQDLAARGFTNVPYRNAHEDIGSTSHVMLTERPKGSSAVLRDREALFHPLLRHLPNLTAGVGGAGLPLGALMAGDREGGGS